MTSSYGTSRSEDMKSLIEKFSEADPALEEARRTQLWMKNFIRATVVAVCIGSLAVVIGFFVEFDLIFGAESEQVNDDGSLCTSSYKMYSTSDSMCNTRPGPILEGVDVVDYFSSGATVSTLGSSSHPVTYRGYDFYFSSSVNAALFVADPGFYAPKYGGFCAFGLSGMDPRNLVTKEDQLFTVPASVDQFSIIDGALYLFRGEGAKELFLEDPATFISGSDTTWASWFGDASCGGFYNTMCFM